MPLQDDPASGTIDFDLEDNSAAHLALGSQIETGNVV